jgi:hypothetical protein
VSAAPRAPLDSHSTRTSHFRALAGSGTAVVGWAIASVVAFAIGASQHSVAIMLGGPLALAGLVLAIAWVKADGDAENDFFNAFATAHHLNHWPKWSINGFTPLLSGGDRRHCEHWMEANGRGIGWYTFEVRVDNGDRADTWQPHDFTLATVELGELGMARFQGIYLRQRRGLFDHLDSDANWLRGHDLKKVELESSAFTQRYELWADPDQDDLVLRQLFAPSFVVWLSDHPLAPGFEVRGGELVVFIPGHCGQAGRLEFLLMAAAEISKRIQAELSEAAQAGSL